MSILHFRSGARGSGRGSRVRREELTYRGASGRVRRRERAEPCPGASTPFRPAQPGPEWGQDLGPDPGCS